MNARRSGSAIVSVNSSSNWSTITTTTLPAGSRAATISSSRQAPVRDRVDEVGDLDGGDASERGVEVIER